MHSPVNAGPPAPGSDRSDDPGGTGSYRSHHWDRRSCTIAIILLLIFLAAAIAVWSTLTTDHDPDVDFMVTPTPTREFVDATTETQE